MKKSLVLLLFLLFTVGSISAQDTSTRDSIRTFYNAILDTLESKFLYRDSVDFEPLKAIFMERALRCSTFTQALYQVTPLFDTIGGYHCMIFWKDLYVPATPRREFTEEDFSPQFLRKFETKPTFETKVLDEKYGYILMPGMLTFSGDPDSLSRLTHAWYDQIVAIETNNDIKGWILDLRYNGGGSSAPMTLALYDLLGSTKVYKELDSEKQVVHTQFMKDGMYHYADTLEFSITPAGNVNTEVPVAIINGLITGSAGENVAIAFRGRENVRYIGEETYGFLTGNSLAKLPYGGQMPYTTCYFADRNSYYTPTVMPEVPISKGDNFDDLMLDENVIAAIKFIDSLTPKPIDGDFDGDGQAEQLWIEQNGAQTFTIKSSNASIPKIDLGKCKNVHIVFEEDLNGDGNDEFSIVFASETEGWHSCQLYTIKKGEWCQPIEAFSIYSFNAAQDRISKAKKKKRILLRKDALEGNAVRQEQVIVKLK